MYVHSITLALHLYPYQARTCTHTLSLFHSHRNTHTRLTETIRAESEHCPCSEESLKQSSPTCRETPGSRFNCAGHSCKILGLIYQSGFLVLVKIMKNNFSFLFQLTVFEKFSSSSEKTISTEF